MAQEKEPEYIIEIPRVRVKGTFKPMNFYRVWAAIQSQRYGLDQYGIEPEAAIEPPLELIEAGEKGVAYSNGNTRRLVDWEYWQERYNTVKKEKTSHEAGSSNFSVH